MASVLINPITLWIGTYLLGKKLEMQYFRQHLKIGYMSRLKRCTFGSYNTIYNHVELTDVALGDLTYINSHSKMIKTTIGKYSSIGEYVLCGLPSHPSSKFVSIHPIFYSTLKQSQISFSDADYHQEVDHVSIGNDVWIGSRVIIKGGVTIGNGSIIGAGAMVTSDIPPYAVAAGVPAKVLRFRFSDSDIKMLLESKWWDRDVGWLQKHYRCFHDVVEFRKAFNNS